MASLNQKNGFLHHGRTDHVAYTHATCLACDKNTTSSTTEDSYRGRSNFLPVEGVVLGTGKRPEKPSHPGRQ